MGELLLLQQRMNRLFEDSLGSEAPTGPGGSWTPVADLWETPDAFVLELELPGVEADDVEVEVEDGAVSVRGTRRDFLATGTPERFQCLERSYGPFVRRFDLDRPVDAAGVRRSFEDGLLRLEMPKRDGGTGA